MKEQLLIVKTLKNEGLTSIEVDQILNYLETLEYDLEKTRYIGKTFSKNERLAKYFFLRDKLKIEINSLDENFYVNEVLDQCIDWSEFWRLLVIKKGFCCIRLNLNLPNRFKFIFLSGPNMLSESALNIFDSIYEDMNY